MTPESYTFKQAATRLKVSVRTIHNYVRKGLLEKTVYEGKASVKASGVEDLVIETAFPSMTRSNWIEMCSRLRRLEERMSIVTTLLGFRSDPLRPNESDSQALHSQAKKACTAPNWDDKEVDLWCDILGRVDEVTLTSIAKATGDIQPWFVYLDLCRMLSESVQAKYKEKPTVAQEGRLEKLEHCHKSLRASAVLWMETNRGSLPEVIIKAMVPTSRGRGRQSSASGSTHRT